MRSYSVYFRFLNSVLVHILFGFRFTFSGVYIVIVMGAWCLLLIFVLFFCFFWCCFFCVVFLVFFFFYLFFWFVFVCWFGFLVCVVVCLVYVVVVPAGGCPGVFLSCFTRIFAGYKVSP